MFRPQNTDQSNNNKKWAPVADDILQTQYPALNADGFNADGNPTQPPQKTAAPVLANSGQGKADSGQFDPVADQVARAQMFASMFQMPYIYPTPQQMNMFGPSTPYGQNFAAMQLQATYANLLRKATVDVAVHSQNLYKMYQSSDNGLSHENRKPRPREVKVNGELVTHWSCWFCGKDFSLRRNCARHQKTHDDKTKRHRCEECGVCYRRKSDLRTHLRVHSGEKPYDCKLCHKEFARISDLRSHERRHGEKDHVCSSCGGSFLKKSHFASHDCKSIQKKVEAAFEEKVSDSKINARKADDAELDQVSTDCKKLKTDSEDDSDEGGDEKNMVDKTLACPTVSTPLNTNLAVEESGTSTLPIFQPSNTGLEAQTLFLLTEEEEALPAQDAQSWLQSTNTQSSEVSAILHC